MSRRFAQIVLPLLLAVCAAAVPSRALAQRGPGGGGPGGPGGMMGGGGRGDFGGRMGGEPGGGANYGPAPIRGPQLGPPGRWWDDHRLVKSLNLRADQQRRMDDIFNANKGQLLSLYSNLQHEEVRLATMSPADLQDETKVFAGIDRVAQARADLEKENAHILLQIRHELDPEQLVKLDREIASLR